MVGLDPVVANLVKGVVQGVHHGVLLTFHGTLLQSGVGLVHSQRGGSGTHPLPDLDVAFQVGSAQLEAAEVGHGVHFLGRGDDTGAAIGGAQQLVAGSLAYGFLDLVAQIAGPDVHEMIVAGVHIRHDVDICQRGEGSQRTDGLAHNVSHAYGHTFQNLSGGTQLCAAVEVDLHAAVRQLGDLVLKGGGGIVSVIALSGVQGHLPDIFGRGRIAVAGSGGGRRGGRGASAGGESAGNRKSSQNAGKNLLFHGCNLLNISRPPKHEIPVWLKMEKVC